MLYLQTDFPEERRDFDTTVLFVTFEADEDLNPRVDRKTTNIAITDDDIDEARSEFFLASLAIVNSTSPISNAGSTNPVCICRIGDDDGKKSAYDYHINKAQYLNVQVYGSQDDNE